MQPDRLTDIDFWLGRQPANISLPSQGMEPLWYQHVCPYLPDTPGSTCLEVGAVPGGKLLFLGIRHGYLCTGIDSLPIIDDVASSFENLGISARFVAADFLNWDTDEQYDLVFSDGFIEHFRNVDAVIDKHWRLVRPGGMMLLVVPTLTPFQMLIRVMVYKPWKMREVLKSHNLKIMKLSRLRQAVMRCDGAEILHARYAGEMAVWFSLGEDFVRPWTRPIFNLVKKLESLAQRINLSSRWFSPEVFVLARRQANNSKD